MKKRFDRVSISLLELAFFPGAGRRHAQTFSSHNSNGIEFQRMPIVTRGTKLSGWYGGWGECGAFRDTASPDSRAQYPHDVTNAEEKNDIGWAMWDRSGNFGLLTHKGAAVDPIGLMWMRRAQLPMNRNVRAT
jgi:hypothetical protein